MSWNESFRRGVANGQAIAKAHEHCPEWDTAKREIEALHLKWNEFIATHDLNCSCSTKASRIAAEEMLQNIKEVKALFAKT